MRKNWAYYLGFLGLLGLLGYFTGNVGFYGFFGFFGFFSFRGELNDERFRLNASLAGRNAFVISVLCFAILVVFLSLAPFDELQILRYFASLNFSLQIFYLCCFSSFL